MRRSRVAVLLAVLAAFTVAVPISLPPAASAGSVTAPHPITLAVLGDTPYGAAQVAEFPELIDQINRDARVRSVLHVGDIKNGSSLCTDDYFRHIADEFDTFLDPVIYTPGDNEWTDCHRANNGGHDPLERLDAVRSQFFAEPGSALGVRPMRVDTQASRSAYRTFVENVRWSAAQTVFATVHVVGSNNGLAPWFGRVETPQQTERREAEVEARTAAAVAWIDAAFEDAESNEARGVVIAMQADTFIGDGNTGFTEIVRRIADRSRHFAGEVLLLQGDSHQYLVDRPLLNGHAGYRIGRPVHNLTRVVVEGETTSEWLRLTVDPGTENLFSWERIHRS